MLGLPRSTEYNKRIPKERFYENLQPDSKIKRCFVEQIGTIYWRNKIAPSTTNLAEGRVVTEIEVFEITLKTSFLDEGVLHLIDRSIPYHILFLLRYEGKYQAWIAYKKASAGKTAFKVSAYYHTDWLDNEVLPLKLEGLNMDAAYENFVYQIAGKALQKKENQSLQEAVEKAEKVKILNRQIEVLEAKIRREKQFNVQVKLSDELKELKKELEAQANG